MNCKKGNTLEILGSYAGYYIGTKTEEGSPNCRLSKSYWEKREDAQKALDTMCFRDRSNAVENAFCNGNKGCLSCCTCAKDQPCVTDGVYVAIWDTGTRIEGTCKVNRETKEVFDIDVYFDDSFSVLQGEYVVVDGTEYPVEFTRRHKGFWREL